ncbi:MAG: hypothetical protein SGJ20_07490 [Planctomycetota bacterium]|nr:hypothetical protein [Planctomycetota bacterium]
MLANRGVQCSSCKLPLAIGPDRKLRGVQEAAELRRVVRSGRGKKTIGDWFTDKLTTADGRLNRKVACVWGSLLVGAIVFGSSLLLRLFDYSVATPSRELTLTCLAGDWDDAEAFMQDDPVQLAEFKRWRMRHFTSILDEYRPDGDSVEIGVEIVKSESPRTTVQVSISSDFLGSRSHTQCWIEQDGNWYFQPLETLHATDGIVRVPSKASLPQAKIRAAIIR